MKPTTLPVLALRRHAQSLDNEQGRIQGQRALPGLSRDGLAEASAWAATLSTGEQFTAIWSSDAARAAQTAAAAGSALGLPVLRSPVLREVRAGVLEGWTHAEAERRHPDAYRVWMARGDLDAVPGAEPGDELQARALAFVAMAAGPGRVTEGTQLVITHAAMLRCLVNTGSNRPRATPVPVDHTDVHRLIDPWEALSPRQLGPPWRRPVHRVSTDAHGDYLVKVETPAGRSRFDEDLRLNAAVARETATPALLAAVVDPRNGDQDGGAFTVRRYVTGRTLAHRLRADEEWKLHRFLEKINHGIARAVATLRPPQLPSLGDRIAKVLNGPETEATLAVRRLVADSRVAALLDQRESVSDFDLHRDNVVRTCAGLVKIDSGALCLGPRRWPDACALFGASALYPGGALGDCANRPHGRLLSGESVQTAELRILVTARLLTGLSFFQTGGRRQFGPRVLPYVELYRRALAAIGWPE
jgi:broad specificity phosphatase PhoE